MSVDADRVRAANRLEDVIPSLTGHPLKKKGQEWWTLCPFHPDGEPSLRVNTEKQSWFCDPCAEGGDVIRFVEKFRRVDFQVAIDELAKNALEPPKKRRPARMTAEYVYHDVHGTPTHLVRRMQYDDDIDIATGKPKKEFPVFHAAANGEWVAGAGDQKLPVYQLHKL